MQPRLEPLFLLIKLAFFIREQEEKHIAAFDQRKGVALLIELLLQALAHGAAGLLEPGFGLLRRKLAKQALDSFKAQRRHPQRAGKIQLLVERALMQDLQVGIVAG